MPYTEQIAAIKQKIAETKQAIKALQEKKSTVTDTEELKAINKQISAMQEGIGRLNGDHYIKEADQIATKEGKVVVWSYWPERFYLPFMENVRN